jgi:large subunit ribosomal protein L9
MKVILLQSVPKLGKKDDIITVPDGYAQNALFPKKLAIVATEQAIVAVQRKQQNTITEKKIQHELLDHAIESLEGKSLLYKTKVSQKGSLFSKITPHDISKALFDQHRISIDARLMTIKGSPIKQTGTYAVSVSEGEYQTEFSVIVSG